MAQLAGNSNSILAWETFRRLCQKGGVVALCRFAAVWECRILKQAELVTFEPDQVYGAGAWAFLVFNFKPYT